MKGRPPAAPPKRVGRRPSAAGPLFLVLIFCIFNLISLQHPDLGYKLDLGTSIFAFFVYFVVGPGGIVFTFVVALGPVVPKPPICVLWDISGLGACLGSLGHGVLFRSVEALLERLGNNDPEFFMQVEISRIILWQNPGFE